MRGTRWGVREEGGLEGVMGCRLQMGEVGGIMGMEDMDMGLGRKIERTEVDGWIDFGT